MTPHQTLAVAVRLFAVWMALVVVREIVGSYFLVRGEQEAFRPFIAVMGLIAVAVLLVLWFFPRTIAQGLLPSRSEIPAQPSAPETWFVVGVSLIGLWLAAEAIPGVLRNLAVLFFYASDAIDKGGLASGLVYLFAQIAVGVLLIVGANGIKRFVWWLRHAGLG